jgi:hypothetical protein
MTTVEVLRAAKELIADESRWCQELSAKDIDGELADGSADAVAWCALGAIAQVTHVSLNWITGTKPAQCLHDAAQELCGRSVARANDELGHYAVMNIYARAIELAQEAEHGMVDIGGRGQQRS